MPAPGADILRLLTSAISDLILKRFQITRHVLIRLRFRLRQGRRLRFFHQPAAFLRSARLLDSAAQVRLFLPAYNATDRQMLLRTTASPARSCSCAWRVASRLTVADRPVGVTASTAIDHRQQSPVQRSSDDAFASGGTVLPAGRPALS